MKNNIVKARERQGTSSFDLTLPTEISKKYFINKGDVFKVEAEYVNNNLEIKYSLIYKNE